MVVCNLHPESIDEHKTNGFRESMCYDALMGYLRYCFTIESGGDAVKTSHIWVFAPCFWEVERSMI